LGELGFCCWENPKNFGGEAFTGKDLNSLGFRIYWELVLTTQIPRFGPANLVWLLWIGFMETILGKKENL